MLGSTAATAVIEAKLAGLINSESRLHSASNNCYSNNANATSTTQVTNSTLTLPSISVIITVRLLMQGKVNSKTRKIAFLTNIINVYQIKKLFLINFYKRPIIILIIILRKLVVLLESAGITLN